MLICLRRLLALHWLSLILLLFERGVLVEELFKAALDFVFIVESVSSLAGSVDTIGMLFAECGGGAGCSLSCGSS